MRFLKYPTKAFVDEVRERKVKRYMAVFVILFIMPSLYIAFNLVKKSVYQREAGLFIAENFVFENAQVISKNVISDGDVRRIEVALIGQPVPDETIHLLQQKLKNNSRLENAQLVVRQGAIQQEGLDMKTVQLMNQSMKSGIIEDLYKRNEQVLQSKDDRIDLLQREIMKLRSRDLPIADISTELHAQHPNVAEFTLTRIPVVNLDSMKSDTVTFAYVRFKARPERGEPERLQNWLMARTKADSVRMVVQ